MKRIVIIAIIVLIPIVALSWERRSDSTLYVGFSSGVSYSGFRNYFSEYKHRLLADYQIFAEYQPSREFSLKGGIGFITKGIRYQYTFTDVLNNPFDTSSFISLNYLTIPLEACYNLGKRFNPYIGVGIQFNYLTSARHFAKLPETRNGIEVEPFNNLIDDFYKKIDICLIAEAGVEYRIKPHFSVFAQVNYNYSLLSIYADTNDIVGGKLVKNVAITVNAGIKIGIPIKFTVN